MKDKINKLHPKKLYRNHIMRMAVLAATASGLAYLTGSLFSWIDATIAAVFALVAIRPTFHASMKESFEQIIGTVLGALFGIVLVALLGFNIFTLIVMIAVTFLLAWWMKLGDSGAVMMGITIILVTGPMNNFGAIEARLAGVILGSIFAIVASYFILPGKPDERVIDASMRISKQVAGILNEIATRMGQRENKIVLQETETWLDNIESLISEAAKVKQEAEDAVAGSKWSPMLQRKEAEQALEHITDTENIIFTIYNIANDVAAAIEHDNRLPDTVAINISSMLLSASKNLEEKANRDGYNILDTIEIDNFKAKKNKAVESIKKIDDTQAITLGGSLIQDVTKIRKTLTK